MESTVRLTLPHQQSLMASEDASEMDFSDQVGSVSTIELVFCLKPEPTKIKLTLFPQGGVPGSARWLRERNDALEGERLALVHQTLEVQVQPVYRVCFKLDAIPTSHSS